MGASDDSIREELIDAVLGELSLLRRDVKGLSQLLDTTGRQFKDDGELTLLRFTSRYEQFLNQFAASSTDVLAEAGRFQRPAICCARPCAKSATAVVVTAESDWPHGPYDRLLFHREISPRSL